MNSENSILFNIILYYVIVYYIGSHIFIFYCGGAIVSLIYCTIFCSLFLSNPNVMIFLHCILFCYYVIMDYIKESQIIENIYSQYLRPFRYCIVIFVSKIIIVNIILTNNYLLTFCRLNYYIYVIFLLWVKTCSYAIICYLYFL